jgi:hypothetical protein
MKIGSVYMCIQKVYEQQLRNKTNQKGGDKPDKIAFPVFFALKRPQTIPYKAVN